MNDWRGTSPGLLKGEGAALRGKEKVLRVKSGVWQTTFLIGEKCVVSSLPPSPMPSSHHPLTDGQGPL